MNFLTTALTLFIVFDPFGNIPAFHAVLSRVAEGQRRRIIARELVIALIILSLFLVTGNRVLGVLGLQESAIRISGAIILFLIALGMVFPARSMMGGEAEEDPFIVPLAVPLIAGPSAIALLLLLSSKYPSQLPEAFGALFAAWSGTALILLASGPIMRWMGRRGTRALERLMGMLLVMIAVQMFLDGLAALHPSP
jgi:multiple antibiotic resistance protein